jgi:hypothetical protein
MKAQHRKFAVLLLLGGLFAGYLSPASAQATFKIETLTSTNVSAIEKHFAAGDDRGGIAVSTQKVFLTADNKQARSRK